MAFHKAGSMDCSVHHFADDANLPLIDKSLKKKVTIILTMT